MTRGMPSLSMLRAFEAAARAGSFIQAASNLHMTQGAVSYQVRMLEEQLGIKLFRRAPRKLVLTTDGEKLASSLVKAFGALQTALDDVRPSPAKNVVSVSASASFATKWLVSRIRNFHLSHPEIHLRILGEDASINPTWPDQDIAIRRGAGHWPGLAAKLLHRDIVFPVCSPRFLAEHNIASVGDLRDVPLLNQEGENFFADGPDWSAWFRRVAPNLFGGHADFTQRCRIHYAHSGMVLQAAAEGQGIALASGLLVADDLCAGRLVNPLELSVRSDFAYYMVRSPGKRGRYVQVFLDWLQSEVAKTKRYLDETVATAAALDSQATLHGVDSGAQV